MMTKYTVKDSYGEDQEYDSMLNALDAAKIFDLERLGSKFRLEEGCDGYFRADITKDQLIALGRELIDFAENIKQDRDDNE